MIKGRTSLLLTGRFSLSLTDSLKFQRWNVCIIFRKFFRGFFGRVRVEYSHSSCKFIEFTYCHTIFLNTAHNKKNPLNTTHSYRHLKQRDGKSTPSSLSQPALEEPFMKQSIQELKRLKIPKKTKSEHS